MRTISSGVWQTSFSFSPLSSAGKYLLKTKNIVDCLSKEGRTSHRKPQPPSRVLGETWQTHMIDLDGQAESSYSFSTSRTKVYQAVMGKAGILRYFQHRQKKKSVFSWHKKQHENVQFWATISRKQEPHWNMEYYKTYLKHCQFFNRGSIFLREQQKLQFSIRRLFLPLHAKSPWFPCVNEQI